MRVRKTGIGQALLHGHPGTCPNPGSFDVYTQIILSGKAAARATVYSPLPHANSRISGFSLL